MASLHPTAYSHRPHTYHLFPLTEGIGVLEGVNEAKELVSGS
jgi:hypothetical protein